jgi:ABC-2 type transport system ATP-binding protein
MSQRGVTVFVTTHYLDEAEHCHRLALIHAGRLTALGTVGELKQVFAQRAVLEVTCPRVAEALESFGSQDFVLDTSVFGTRIHLSVDDAEEGRRRALELLQSEGNLPASVERIVPSLEDVFIHHVSQEEARFSTAASP